jgi:hypothetical protein
MSVTPNTSHISLTIVEKQYNTLNWFKDIMIKYFKRIKNNADILKSLGITINEPLYHNTNKKEYINTHFDQLRNVCEMLEISLNYYPDLNYHYNISKFGQALYDKIIYFYNELANSSFKFDILTQSENEEEIKLFNIFLENMTNAETMLEQLLLLDTNTDIYNQKQLSKEKCISFIHNFKTKHKVNKPYNLRNNKKIDYTGMDTIEPKNDDDDIDIWYDYTVNYDADYNPDNLEDRIQVILDDLCDSKYYKYVVNYWY